MTRCPFGRPSTAHSAAGGGNPRQRASNENINGLRRQHLPRTVNMRDYTQADLDLIADEFNGRPRRTLEFATSEKLARMLR